MELRRAVVVLAVAAVIAAAATVPAAAGHGPTHSYSSNWTTAVNTSLGDKTGTMSFRAVTPAGREAGLQATFASHFPGAETDPDTDGDGLPDSWETKGYDADGDGKIDVPLPQMGADPRHKDLFVQLDQMLGHTIDRAAVKMVADGFADAPVSNPDGVKGIALHVDQGPGTVMNPNTGATWGDLSHAGATKEKAVLGSFAFDGAYEWADFDAIKNANFPAARNRVFRYILSVNRWGSASEGATGLTRTAPGSDIILSLGTTCPAKVDCRGTTQGQAGTFMHELGHSLGLLHGGDEAVNYKPDYLSIMNYAFQLTGLIVNGVPGRLDYSRFPAGTLGPLDEQRLSEGDGFGRPALTVEPYSTLVYCPGQTPERDAGTQVSTTGPVDWNCNNKLENGTVAADVNGDGEETTLRSYDDWNHIVFKGGAIGAKGTPPQPPAQTRSDEPPADKLIAAAGALLGDRTPPTVTISGPLVVHRPQKGVVRVRAHDDKGLQQLIFVVDKKTYQFTARNHERDMVGRVALVYLGKRTIKGAAIDLAGNRSRTVVLHVRVLGRKARAARGSAHRRVR
jgi:hypothetical protein